MVVSRESIQELIQRSHVFRNLTPEQMDDVVESCSSLELAAGQVIFEIDQPADYFYIILEGQVTLSRPLDEDSEETLYTLERGDTFGFEALKLGQVHRLNARATEDVTLLLLDDATIVDMEGAYPALRPPLDLLRTSYNLLLSTTDLSFLPEGESVYYMAHQHILMLLARLLFPLIGLTTLGSILLTFTIGSGFTPLLTSVTVLFDLLMLGWGAWIWLDWSIDYYIVTRDRVVYLERVPLLYDSRQEAPLETILSGGVQSNLIGRWLHFGDVVVRTYTGNLIMTGLKDPAEVIAVLDEKRERVKRRTVRAERRAIEMSLRQRLGYAVPVQTAPSTSTSPTDTATRAGRLLRMRFEKDNVVTYRKHWFVLLVKAFIPTLVLVGFMLLGLLRLSGRFSSVAPLTFAGLWLLVMLVAAAFWLYQYEDWRNDVYILTRDQIIDVYKRPLGDENKRSAPLKNILSIESKRRGLLGWLLNFGTVYIRIGDTQFDFENVWNPSAVQREVFQRFQEFINNEKKKEEEGHRKRIADWLEIYTNLQMGRTEFDPPPNDDQIG